MKTFEEIKEIHDTRMSFIPGFFRAEDVWIVYQLSLKIPKNSTIVEIGSLFGKSAYAWALFCPDSKIYCIDDMNSEQRKNRYSDYQVFYDTGFTDADMFPQGEMFKHYIREFNNVTLIKGTSPFVEWNEPIDLVFIDAAHSDNDLLKKNIQFWNSYLKENGIMSGHDFKIYDTGNSHNNPGTKYAVIEEVRKYAKKMKKPITIYGDNSFWIVE